MPLRVPLLLAAVAAFAPAVALAHSGPDDEATPEMAGATWRVRPAPPVDMPEMAGAPMHGRGEGARVIVIHRGPEGPRPGMGPHEGGPPCSEREGFAPPPPRMMGPPAPRMMEGPSMRFAGPPPCGPCLVRRPVRLHDGWLSWPGKTYF